MGNLLKIAQKRRLAILNEVPAIMHLSYATTTDLNLLIETQSGDDWKIDWGDGIWERYVSSSTYRTKTFSSSTSGVARVRSATGRGLSDILGMRSNVGTWSFDATALLGLTSLADLRLVGNGFTGDMTGVSDLNNLTYLRLASNGFTGDMTGVSDLDELTYSNLTGNFVINYMPATWAPNYQYFLFRPTTATNPMGTSEIDQALIDGAATTWTGVRTLYIDGNNGVRSSASDAAVATLQGMGVTLYLNV